MFNVIRTKVSFYRNVKDFKFVPKIDEESKNKIVNIVKNALPNFALVKIGDIDTNTISKLYGLQNTAYQTALVGKSGEVGITLFDGEHLTITASNYGYDKNTFNLAKEIASTLNNKISFAFNDEYGYLMSDLSLIGNGLKIECDFALSGINKLEKILQVKQNLQKLGYKLIETEQEDIYTLSTKCNLGKTENEVMAEFDKMVQNLQQLEAESVKMLGSTDSDEMYDKYVRSIAILKNAHILQYEELKALTNELRVGLNLGFNDVKLDKISKLQEIILNKNSEFVSKSELIDLATKVKKILKGE